MLHHRMIIISRTSDPMEVSAALSTGYGKPPWNFHGSALYQFHLVKSEVARALIPKEFKLVEAFGYTLGGFFLAAYEDSPAGVFDELVVIAGLVWNPPTSCAWASRVLVSSNEACLHGRKDVGLPSYVASFAKRKAAVASKRSSPHIQTATEVTQLSDPLHSIFSINLINTLPQATERWMGPSIKMSLPSFSGRTQENPRLLKYSCQMDCRVRFVKPVKVAATKEKTEGETDGSELSMRVMLSKPVLAMEFNCMNMKVEPPFVVAL